MSDEEAGPEELAALEAERPRRRGDCVDGMRPCPWVSCRYHLAHDRIRRLSVDDAVTVTTSLDETCTLDLADGGALDGQAVADAIGMSRPLVNFNVLLGMVKIRERTTREDWDEPEERADPDEHSHALPRSGGRRRPPSIFSDCG